MAKTPVTTGQRNKSYSAGCVNTTAQTDLDINNVRARILNGGDLWWDPVGQIPFYEVPIGSGLNSIFCGSIWIAGIDDNGQIKAACQTYRQGGSNDFWAGPVSRSSTGDISVDVTTCEKYDRIWSLTRKEVQDFVSDGILTDAIRDWPGNGNAALGQSPLLAPFIDINNDGIYNYSDGDYPAFDLDFSYPGRAGQNASCTDYLMGDKNLWWVFNDIGNQHTETLSPVPIGLEVQAQAFAFRTTDELNNMTFYHYKMINRSNETLNNIYWGQWTDVDMGNASDDYVACDVRLGLGYAFNGDDEDEGAEGYGFNPPAVGMDFLAGPLADPFDGIDNNSDGVIDEEGERIIMSKFHYYISINNQNNGNPYLLDDYYQYLSGLWLDGTPVTFGADGRVQSNPPCNYMYPGNTDPAFPGQTWTMANSGIQPNDMRFLMSAGKFTLQPGAVNNVVVSAIWARATKGGPLASVELLRLADRKAQQLFDNCFEMSEGPAAPDVAIREMDQQIILSLENTAEIESYHQLDPLIPTVIFDTTDIDLYDTLSTEEREYRFQGYKIYQLADETVSPGELNDPSKARLIRQIDLKDDIYKIVNFSFDQVLGAWIPEQVADSNTSTNLGMYHDFLISTDYFTGQQLINYRPCYYTVVSYAWNSFRSFDPSQSYFTQPVPYKQGYNNVKVYSAIPHKPLINQGGTVLHAEYGQSFAIRQLEGYGNGGNLLDLAEETVNEILSGGIADPVAEQPLYIPGAGPVNIYIYDPYRLKAGDFHLSMDGITLDNHWFLTSDQFTDTVSSSLHPIGVVNAQLVPGHAISVDVLQDAYPEFGNGHVQNGFLGAAMTPSDWIDWVVDKNIPAGSQFDWIRPAGVIGNPDPQGVYENVLGGTWSPVKLSSNATGKGTKPALNPFDNFMQDEFLASVDVVLTPDKSKWTRALVVEMAASGAVNGAPRHEARRQPSVDKEGRTVAGGALSDGTESAANFIRDSSMGWFPGYAINVETGERLNVAFGENSSLPQEHGTDMLWNPTRAIVNGDSVMGGMHVVYIFGHNADGANDVPVYDGGAMLVSKLLSSTPVPAAVKRTVWKDAMWNAIPLGRSSFSTDGIPLSEVKISLRVYKQYRNRIPSGVSAVNAGNPLYQFAIAGSQVYNADVASVESDLLRNIRVVPNPYYSYSSYERTRMHQNDKRVRITGLPDRCTVSIYSINGTLIRTLKRDVTGIDVSAGAIAVEGAINHASTMDWDLKNNQGHEVASGIYYFHIDAGASGEKVLKWLGVMRDGNDETR